MAKRSALELVEHYYQGLIFSLPMKDDKFMEELSRHDLLPENAKRKLEELPIRKDRTSYFLDNVIKARLAVGDKTCFVNLLTVMNNSKYDHVKDLPKQIQSEYDVDAKCKLMMYIHSLSDNITDFCSYKCVCTCVCVCCVGVCVYVCVCCVCVFVCVCVWCLCMYMHVCMYMDVSVLASICV